MSALNPLIESGLRANGMLSTEISVEEIPGAYTAIEAFRCNECCSIHEDEDDAKDCCPEEDRLVTVFCPVCANRDPKSYAEAVDCCLWKDFPINKRLSIVDDMEKGALWLEAIFKAAGGQQ